MRWWTGGADLKFQISGFKNKNAAGIFSQPRLFLQFLQISAD